MRALLLTSVLLLAATANASDSCEPEDIRGATNLEAALQKCEEIARVTTSAPTRYAALCRGASYAFELAEPEGERSADFAKRGVELASRARDLVPGRVEAHYRYALCLGICCRESKVTAVTKVSDVIAAAKRAIEIDERYDRGGPHRLLALLYSEAPRWVGPGDHDLARDHLARLMTIAGDYEENKLTAVKVHRELGDDDKARAALKTVDPSRVPEGPERMELRSEKERLEKALQDE